MIHTPSYYTTKVISVLILGLALTACSNDDSQQHDAPPPKVSVIKVEPTTVTLSNELTGRLESSRKAEIRARTSGIIQQRLFTEGSEVKKDQKLFNIDDAPLQAILAKAKATLIKSAADQARMEPLLAANAISQKEFDLATQAYEIAKADYNTAQINVDYAHITAPISGRISRAFVSEGELVGHGTPTLLATIHQNNPLYVNMTQSATDVMKIRKAIDEGQIKLVDGYPEVEITLEDGTTYPLAGKLLFTDPTVDENTGQVSLRAQIPNPDNILFPGLFVNVKVSQTQVDHVFIIPKNAIKRGQQDTAIIVKSDGSFSPTPVTINNEYGSNWLVSKGLKSGDLVLVNGSVKLMPHIQKVDAEIINLTDAKPTQPSAN